MHVKAQCPNWIDLDRMFVLVNGRIHPQHNYFREQHPDIFRSGNVKIDRKLDLTLERDAHIIVVVGDLGSDLSRILGSPEAKCPRLCRPIPSSSMSKGTASSRTKTRSTPRCR